MLKFILLLLFARLFGIPFVAIIVLLVILYLLDRQFVGLAPSIMKPIRRRSRIRKLRQHISFSPNDVSAKHELARLLIERKKYREALNLLEPLQHTLADSAEYWDDLGHCFLHTGNEERGEACVVKALELNPRVKYGAPYLRLAAYHSKGRTDQALAYLKSFQQIQSSSCEAYARLASIYRQLGQPDEARRAIEEGLGIYRTLPRYKKKAERKWAVHLQLKKLK